MRTSQIIILLVLLCVAEPIALSTGHWLGLLAFAPFIMVYIWFIHKQKAGNKV